MHSPLSGWIPLALLVFVLGMRHGLDADHLVAIDGMTRFNCANKPRLAKWCGALFSLGHGLVVMAFALMISAFATNLAPPQWLNDFGAWVSIGFLVALGLLNLSAALGTPAAEPVRLAGLKARFASGLTRAGHPLLVMAVGSLFAVSFDTLSQAALFAVSLPQFRGAVTALVLGALFTLGMMLVDGFNGLWIYRLILRSDKQALIASRIFSLVVSFLSLGVAVFGMVNRFSVSAAEWSANTRLAAGFAVIALVFLGFTLAMLASKAKAAR